jgi:hypothetical protein
MSVKVEKNEMFSGKSDGITFEKLDEKVLSWETLKIRWQVCYATLERRIDRFDEIRPSR